MISPFNKLGPFGKVAAAAGGGTSPLLTDLVDWWEDANATGKHAANALTGAYSSVSGAPNGLNGFGFQSSDNLDTAAMAGVSYPHTYAFIVRRSASVGGFRYFAYVDSSTWIRFNADDSLYMRYRFGNDSWVDPLGSTDYTSVVVTYIGTTGTLYVGGALVGSVFGNSGSPAGLDYLFQMDPNLTLAVAAIASRGWGADDVSEFHNSGNFLTYADL